MFRIHDILVRIRMWMRILGSLPFTNGSLCGSGSGWAPALDTALFVSHLQDAHTILYAFSFLKLHLHHSLKIKKSKEVTKQKKSRFFFIFLLVDGRIGSGFVQINYGSGCGSRKPKNIDPMDPDPDADPEHWQKKG